VITITRDGSGYRLRGLYIPPNRVRRVDSPIAGVVIHHLLDGAGSWVPVHVVDEEEA